MLVGATPEVLGLDFASTTQFEALNTYGALLEKSQKRGGGNRIRQKSMPHAFWQRVSRRTDPFEDFFSLCMEFE